jgi:hypothetical protein
MPVESLKGMHREIQRKRAICLQVEGRSAEAIALVLCKALLIFLQARISAQNLVP